MHHERAAEDAGLSSVLQSYVCPGSLVVWRLPKQTLPDWKSHVLLLRRYQNCSLSTWNEIDCAWQLDGLWVSLNLVDV